MSAERAGLARYPASFLPGAGMTEMLAGSRGSQTWFCFRMIMAARALGLGMLGGV